MLANSLLDRKAMCIVCYKIFLPDQSTSWLYLTVNSYSLAKASTIHCPQRASTELDSSLYLLRFTSPTILSAFIERTTSHQISVQQPCHEYFTELMVRSKRAYHPQTTSTLLEVVPTRSTTFDQLRSQHRKTMSSIDDVSFDGRVTVK